MDHWERAEEQLARDYDEGLLTLAEFNAELRDLARDYADARDEAAQEAYDRERDRW